MYLTFEMQSLSYEPFLAVTEFSGTGKTCEATAKRIDGSKNRDQSGSDCDSAEAALLTLISAGTTVRPPNFLDSVCRRTPPQRVGTECSRWVRRN